VTPLNWNNLGQFQKIHSFVFILTAGMSFVQLPSTSSSNLPEMAFAGGTTANKIPLAGCCWSLVTVDHTASTCAWQAHSLHERNRHFACAHSVPEPFQLKMFLYAFRIGTEYTQMSLFSLFFFFYFILFYCFFLLLLQGFIIIIFIIVIIMF
jgi:hypothetical protein